MRQLMSWLESDDWTSFWLSLHKVQLTAECIYWILSAHLEWEQGLSLKSSALYLLWCIISDFGNTHTYIHTHTHADHCIFTCSLHLHDDPFPQYLSEICYGENKNRKIEEEQKALPILIMQTDLIKLWLLK